MDQADRPRPSPEALLAAAGGEGRGKLKIFLGAAPGVGKTFEMLQAARRKRADGVDVVIGLVETHQRPETAALLVGLEIVPRRRVDYKGRVLEEMDLDAILRRRPALALVDELAHTNAPGSRHPKRYLDVEELLAAGIDVHSTLNIQHVESLNDVVARITRVRVRETVPDRIIDRADEVEVVDLTPEELIGRLADGKVYVREQAQRAIRHYFQPGNLTALRELALRRTAERVDAQMVDYMRAHAISGPWGAGERILALIDDSGAGAALVRYAKRMADRLKADFTALHVETPRDQMLGEDGRAAIDEALRLAERLGGQALTIPGAAVAQAALAHAAATNVTHIILAKSRRSRWFLALHGSIVHDLAARAAGPAIHVIPADGAPRPPAPATRRLQPERSLRPYGRAALHVAAATVLGLAIDRLVSVPNISLVFLTAVLASAVRHGRWPGLFGAFLSMLAYNFFFLEPRFTLTIEDPANVVAFVFFAIVSVLASGLAARVQAHNEAARLQAARTAALYAFSRKIAGIASLDDLIWAASFQVADMLKVEAVILAPDPQGALVVKGGFPPEDHLDEADIAAAAWAFDRDCPTGWASDTLPGARRLFLPLRAGRARVGVLGIQRADRDRLLAPDERRLLDALADQIAIAIARIRLADDVDAARLATESERLRSAILTAVSHDLKTPLAGILGAITTLRRFGGRVDSNEREALMATVQDEAERMSRFVGNLLDMTRLDAGAVRPKLEALDLSDVVGAALQRTARLLAQHAVVVDIAADLPMLRLDFVLMEQVLVNLLDNAAKYAPPGGRVAVTARRAGPDGDVEIAIADEGPGLSPEALAHVFDKFYRAERGDRDAAGTGLGLAICRGFLEAMGAAISARNRPEGGAVFAIRVPASAAAPPLAGPDGVPS